MTKLVIHQDILNQLTCSICKEYLSIFPIHIGTDGESPVCGRCKVLPQTTLRDEAYEDIAQFIMFPCQYTKNGCTVNNVPRQLKDHEATCLYRKLNCPSNTYEKCAWNGLGKDLIDHVKSTHEHLLMKTDSFDLPFVVNFKENVIYLNNDEVFIVEKEVDLRCGTFSCTVTHVPVANESDKFIYNILLENEDKTVTHLCIAKSTYIISSDRTTSVDIADIQEKLNTTGNVTATLQIATETESIGSSSTATATIAKKKKKPQPNSEIDLNLLQILECSVCFDYMLPPIYQCEAGHSICNQCKPKVAICPECRGPIHDTQNFTLEKMTSHIKFPCKFNKTGCVFVTSANEIRAHETTCEFGTYNCPLQNFANCEFNGELTEVLLHVERNHTTHIMANDTVCVPFNKDTPMDDTCTLLKFDNKLFKMIHKYENEKFKWTVQIIGPYDDKYRFELEIVGQNGCMNRVVALCAPLSNPNVLSDNKYCATLYYDQICHVLTGTEFTFKIRIRFE